MHHRPTRRGFLQSAGSLAVCAAWMSAGGWGAARAQGAASVPGAPEAPFRSLDQEWQDDRRGRPVPVRLYLPATASANRRVPLVLFSHGIGGSRNGYRYLGTHLARTGWASLHLQHVGSDRQVWTGGNPFAVIGRLQNAARESEAIARAEDMRFALDRVLGGEWSELIDADRVVAAGHSYGANTALLVAGAQVERRGQPVPLGDARVKAAVLLSAPPFYGEPEPQRVLAPVTMPTLHITTTDDVIRIPGYYSGVEDRLTVFESVASRLKVLTVFEGGSHSVFTDRMGTGGPVVNARIKAATQDLVSSFLAQLFDPAVDGMRTWPQRHDGIVSRFEIRG